MSSWRHPGGGGLRGLPTRDGNLPSPGSLPGCPALRLSPHRSCRHNMILVYLPSCPFLALASSLVSLVLGGARELPTTSQHTPAVPALLSSPLPGRYSQRCLCCCVTNQQPWGRADHTSRDALGLVHSCFPITPGRHTPGVADTWQTLTAGITNPSQLPVFCTGPSPARGGAAAEENSGDAFEPLLSGCSVQLVLCRAQV